MPQNRPLSLRFQEPSLCFRGVGLLTGSLLLVLPLQAALAQGTRPLPRLPAADVSARQSSLEGLDARIQIEPTPPAAPPVDRSDRVQDVDPAGWPAAPLEPRREENPAPDPREAGVLRLGHDGLTCDGASLERSDRLQLTQLRRPVRTTLWKGTRCRVEVRAEGRVSLLADEGRVERLDALGRFTVVQEGPRSLELDVRSDREGRLSWAFYEDGKQAEFGDAHQRWLATLFTALAWEHSTAATAGSYPTIVLNGDDTTPRALGEDFPRSAQREIDEEVAAELGEELAGTPVEAAVRIEVHTTGAEPRPEEQACGSPRTSDTAPQQVELERAIAALELALRELSVHESARLEDELQRLARAVSRGAEEVARGVVRAVEVASEELEANRSTP